MWLSGEVKLNYLSRQYFVTMGLYLMTVLLPFDTSMTLTFGDLREVTRLEDRDLARHIQQLVDIKLLSTTTSNNVVQLSVDEVCISAVTFVFDIRITLSACIKNDASVVVSGGGGSSSIVGGVWVLTVVCVFFGQVFDIVDLTKPVSNVRLSVRTYVRPLKVSLISM